MLLSIADGRPRNLESVRTQSLFPDNVQSGAANIIAFIQEYYDYINTHGLPSAEIGSVITDKDIDVASNDYLDNIGNLIANNIPNSTSLDKVSLYKIIVKYYNTRGSEDSIVAFFKIFLNETVSLFYPKEYLFAPSSGAINWDPYDVPPLERTTPPVNGVADTITVNNSGLENLILVEPDDKILVLDNSSNLLLTTLPRLQTGGITINFPTLTYAGLYDGRAAYTGPTAALTNILWQPYALYWDSYNTQWTLRGGAGKTLTMQVSLYDSGYTQYDYELTLVEDGLFNNKPRYRSLTNPFQQCFYVRGVVAADNRWYFYFGVDNFAVLRSTANFSSPELVASWESIFNDPEHPQYAEFAILPVVTSTGTNAAYWYSKLNAQSSNIQPPTDNASAWDIATTTANDANSGAVAATLFVNPDGNNNTILYTALIPGTSSNYLSIAYAAPVSTSANITATIDGDAITIVPSAKGVMAISGISTPSGLNVRLISTGAYNGNKPQYSQSGATAGVNNMVLSHNGSAWTLTRRDGTNTITYQAEAASSADFPDGITFSAPTVGSGVPTISAAVSTAAQVIAAVNTTTVGVYINAAASGDVSGSVAATARTYLTGGTAPTSPTTGVPFLHYSDGDAAATQPTNGNLFARTGTWPNRHVYKCIDDGSSLGHSIIWQLQNDLPGWREWRYDDHKGFASDDYKIQDSRYWQNYSYDIQCNSDPSTWRDAFLKFVHPAGLKLFTSLLLEMQSLNVWDSPISYQLTNPQDRYSWLSALNPTDIYQRHTPKYQPGWISLAGIEYIFTALFAGGSIALSREVIMVFQFIMASAYSERQLISQEYDLNGIKFRDPSRLGDGFLGADRTIQSMINSGLESYVFKNLNVASVVRQGSGSASTQTNLTTNYPLI